MRVTAGVALPALGAGPERMVTQLVRAALDADPALTVTVHAVSRRGRHDARTVLARLDPRARVRVTPLPARPTARAQARLRFPPQLLLSGRHDVFHQYHLDADPAVADHRLVVTVNDAVALDWPAQEGPLSPYARALVARARVVVTPSRYAGQEAVERLGADPDRVRVIPHGVDHALFSPAGTAAVGPGRYLLHVGGDTPRKNVRRSIAALHRVRSSSEGQDVRLVLAGPVARSEGALRASAPPGLAAGALEFVGTVDDDHLARLYRGAAALLYPSLAEGFGLPVLEAMACGTPVVTADGSALREVAGDAAVLVDPSDVDAIAAGIVEILGASESGRERRRAAGLDHAAGFTWDASARALLEVYREVADG